MRTYSEKPAAVAMRRRYERNQIESPNSMADAQVQNRKRYRGKRLLESKLKWSTDKMYSSRIDRDIIQQFQRGKSAVDIAIRMTLPVSRVMAAINKHLELRKEPAK